MIREIENRRSIRKYKPDEIERKLIEEIIYSASLAPSAKNRQLWKFIVYQGKEKDKLVDRNCCGWLCRRSSGQKTEETIRRNR